MFISVFGPLLFMKDVMGTALALCAPYLLKADFVFSKVLPAWSALPRYLLPVNLGGLFEGVCPILMPAPCRA
jgi:hypothetical protein